jgi:putative ABC transport system permease protein
MQAPGAYQQIGIRIQDHSAIPQAITAIETAWKKIYPDQVFEVEFLDESVENLYKAEARLYTLFKLFSMLALCISCLGLWGLATLAAQHRTKEVGIRKVLGASAVTIVALMLKEFLSLVAIGLLVAAPLAYYFMENWLQNFAFRIDIGWQVFMVAGMVSIAIAFITVFVQTMKAAIANPVDSLRSE